MKVLLACNAGMSTGIMRLKIEEEAAARGMELTCDAIPMGELEAQVEGADVILLGPQIRFALNDVQQMAPGKPVMVISAPDFGTMNAKKVVDEMLSLL